MHGRTTITSTGRRHRFWTGPKAKGTTAVRGPAHPDDTCRGAFQLGQRTGNPGLLNRIDEGTGRE